MYHSPASARSVPALARVQGLFYAVAVVLVFTLAWPETIAFSRFFSSICIMVMVALGLLALGLRSHALAGGHRRAGGEPPTYGAAMWQLTRHGLAWGLWLPVVFLLWQAAQIFRAEDFGYAWHEVEKKLCWLALPLAAAWVGPPVWHWRGMAFYFAVAMALLLPVMYAIALRRYAMHPGADFVFNGSSLVYPLGMHRVYVAFHSLVALWAVIWLFISPTQAPHASAGKTRRLAYGALLVALFFLQQVMASRMSLAVTAVLAVFAALVFFIRLRRVWLLLLPIVVLSTGLAIVLSTPGGRETLAYLQNGFNLPDPDFQDLDNALATRYYIWQSAWQLVANHPLLGLGTGNTEAALASQYAENGFLLGVQYHFNAHNQYLQTWLNGGLPGVFLLLAMLGNLFYLGLRTGGPGAFFRFGWAYCALALIWALSQLTECFLEAQRGTILLALVYTGLCSLYPHLAQQAERPTSQSNPDLKE